MLHYVHDLPAQAHDDDDDDDDNDDDDDGHKLKRWSKRLEDWPSLRSKSGARKHCGVDALAIGRSRINITLLRRRDGRARG